MIQFEEHIFQMGWFNHQLVTTLPETNIAPENRPSKKETIYIYALPLYFNWCRISSINKPERNYPSCLACCPVGVCKIIDTSTWCTAQRLVNEGTPGKSFGVHTPRSNCQHQDDEKHHSERIDGIRSPLPKGGEFVRGHDQPRLMGVARHLLSRWYIF